MGENNHWCSTRTHWNNSYIEGGWGFCSQECVNQDKNGMAMNKSETDESLWDEGFFNLVGDIDIGNCYTYNPKHPSSAGFQGQFYSLLGM